MCKCYDNDQIRTSAPEEQGPPRVEICSGGLDEDGDGAIDCEDTDCATSTLRE